MKHRCALAASVAVIMAFPIARPVAAGAAPAPDPAGHELFLWKVSGGNAIVYLLGSIHVGTAGLYPLPPIIEKAFQHAALLVEEVDPSRVDPARRRQLIAARGRYPPGDSLENHLSPPTGAALRDYLRRTGQNPAMFAPLRPWLASLMVMLGEAERHGIAGEYGIDRHFAQEAAAAHKPTGELETFAYQIDLMSGLSPPLQDELLRSSLSDAKHADRDVEAMLHAWQRGDAAEMQRVLTREVRADPELRPVYDLLLTKRNAEMVDKIEAYLKAPQTSFIVVGAAHLIGKRGIVSLLEARHYKVERLRGN